MKLLPLAIVFAILAWVVSLNMARAQGFYVYQNPSQAAFDSGYYAAQNGFNQGMQMRTNQAMLNAYREAHGLPRCSIGLLPQLFGGPPPC